MPSPVRSPLIPGQPTRPELPNFDLVSLHRRITEIEDRLTAIESGLSPKLTRIEVGYSVFSKMSVNGSNYYGLLTLPAGAAVACYGRVLEPIRASGVPRGGFVALTSAMLSVGTGAAPTTLLLQKEAFGARPDWTAAADKGATFNADAKLTPVLSVTADTPVFLVVAPNANGDLMTVVAGKVEFLFVTIEP